MHKKIEAELVSLAHSILQLENKGDVSTLHKKAQDVYEKLSVLKFVDAYVNGTPTLIVDEEVVPEIKENIIEEVVEVVPEIIAIEEEVQVLEEVVTTIEEENSVIEEVEEPKETLTPEQVNEIFGNEDKLVKDDVKDLQSTQFTLEEEFKDAISSDIATNLFEKVTKENPVIEEPKDEKKRSLNDTIFSANLQVGLNDRIAFVKHLFEGSQEDFNRVLSQLNSFKSEEEAKTFLQEFVKLDYDWSTKDEYEERLISIIERKFM